MRHCHPALVPHQERQEVAVRPVINIEEITDNDMAKMNFTPADDFVDEVWGKTGTPERDKMEEKVKEELNTYLLGDTIKKERIKQNLT